MFGVDNIGILGFNKRQNTEKYLRILESYDRLAHITPKKILFQLTNERLKILMLVCIYILFL